MGSHRSPAPYAPAEQMRAFGECYHGPEACATANKIVSAKLPGYSERWSGHEPARSSTGSAVTDVVGAGRASRRTDPIRSRPLFVGKDAQPLPVSSRCARDDSWAGPRVDIIDQTRFSKPGSRNQASGSIKCAHRCEVLLSPQFEILDSGISLQNAPNGMRRIDLR